MLGSTNYHSMQYSTCTTIIIIERFIRVGGIQTKKQGAAINYPFCSAEVAELDALEKAEAEAEAEVARL